mgnify:CR=1 FL=1
MRTATLEDIPLLIELAVVLHKESRFARFPVNLAKVEGFFRMLLAYKPQEHVIFLVDGDPIYAMFIASVRSFWWGDLLESSDIMVYVSPSKRGGSSASRFIREYKRRAKALGVMDCKIAVGTGIHPERTGRFYEHHKFSKTGFIYLLTE